MCGTQRLFHGRRATKFHIRVHPKQPLGEDAFGFASADIMDIGIERKQYNEAGKKNPLAAGFQVSHEGVVSLYFALCARKTRCRRARPGTSSGRSELREYLFMMGWVGADLPDGHPLQPDEAVTETVEGYLELLPKFSEALAKLDSNAETTDKEKKKKNYGGSYEGCSRLGD
eukprot:jgi/Tetstr1/422719/TSEL_013516.t1